MRSLPIIASGRSPANEIRIKRSVKTIPKPYYTLAVSLGNRYMNFIIEYPVLTQKDCAAIAYETAYEMMSHPGYFPQQEYVRNLIRAGYELGFAVGVGSFKELAREQVALRRDSRFAPCSETEKKIYAALNRILTGGEINISGNSAQIDITQAMEIRDNLVEILSESQKEDGPLNPETLIYGFITSGYKHGFWEGADVLNRLLQSKGERILDHFEIAGTFTDIV